MLYLSIASVAVRSLDSEAEYGPVIHKRRTNVNSLLLHFFALGEARSAKLAANGWQAL